MKVENVRYFHKLDFAEYLQMPGVSFSSLKAEANGPITESKGMRLGTRVHNYLLEPEKYDWQQADVVIPMALALRKQVGALLKIMDREVAVTADFVHNGIRMPYRGRFDLGIQTKLICDFKILAGTLEAATQRFEYDKAISGYCLATGTPAGLLIGYNKKSKDVEFKFIKPSANFWEYQVVRLGVPA